MCGSVFDTSFPFAQSKAYRERALEAKCSEEFGCNQQQTKKCPMQASKSIKKTYISKRFKSRLENLNKSVHVGQSQYEASQRKQSINVKRSFHRIEFKRNFLPRWKMVGKMKNKDGKNTWFACQGHFFEKTLGTLSTDFWWGNQPNALSMANLLSTFYLPQTSAKWCNKSHCLRTIN